MNDKECCPPPPPLCHLAHLHLSLLLRRHALGFKVCVTGSHDNSVDPETHGCPGAFLRDCEVNHGAEDKSIGQKCGCFETCGMLNSQQ